jgi:branched-chain amino acid aminotransferase
LARGTHEALPDERNEGILVYINGEFYRREEAKISVFDSGFLVGDGVWKGIRLHDGEFAFLDLHLDRLFEGAKAIDLDIGLTREEITEALHETVRRNGMEGSSGVHVRLMVTRGDKKTPSQNPRLVVGGPNVVIIAEHRVADPGVREQGFRLFTSTVRCPPPDTLDQKLNCHSKMHEVIALVQALKAGADEALMLDPTGAVATCNATNFFVVRRGEVWTSTGHYSLNGITRHMIIDLCRISAIPVFERSFSLTDVYGADEAFVTGTFGGITPVVEVDGRKIGTGERGELTARLTDLYAEAVAEAREGNGARVPQAVGVVRAAQRLDGAHVLLQAEIRYRRGRRATLRPLPENHGRGSSRCQGGLGGDGRRRQAGRSGGHPRPLRASRPLLQEHGAPSPVLLIRDPIEMLPSLAKQLSSPTLRDTGLREQAVIVDSILARGENPTVLDARELLLDPPGVLRQACARLGIPFEDAMLSWPAGPKPEDGVWANHWYHNIHSSTGFAPYNPPRTCSRHASSPC